MYNKPITRLPQSTRLHPIGVIPIKRLWHSTLLHPMDVIPIKRLWHSTVRESCKEIVGQYWSTADRGQTLQDIVEHNLGNAEWRHADELISVMAVHHFYVLLL